MQINIDKKSGIFITIIAALLVVIAAISLNSRDDGFFGMRGMGMHDGDRNERNENRSALNGSDEMFLQMMIPHHEQAVEMSNLALAKSKNPEVLKLAQQIKDGQSAEIIQMKSWLGNAAMPGEMGHDMGGMMGPEDMTALQSATGTAFDKLFLTSMIAHHEGALHMVLMIKDSSDPKLLTLRDNIIKTQSAELETMKKLLG